MGFIPKKALILARGSRIAPLQQRSALEHIAQALPEDTDPRIWSQLEIFDPSGTAYEIDAVVLGHYGLYVVDIKNFSGRVMGDERTWSVETAGGPPPVMDDPLLPVRRNAQRLEEFFVQELGPGRISVEPLIWLPNEDLEIVLPECARRHVVTTGELLRGLQSGELPGDVAPPTRVPVDAPTAQAIASILGGLRRRVRPGRGSLLQELSLLQREIVADLTAAVRTRDSVAAPSGGGRGDELRYQIEETAAAWVIACVFITVLEERGYIEHRFTGEDAEQRERDFVAEDPSSTRLGYLKHLLSAIGQHPACDAILGPGNHSLWDMSPTEEGAAALLSFFRESHDSDRDRYGRDLLSDKFWGDLYQSISDPLRNANAFIQTPPFIAEFLLGRTLDQAIAERGVAWVRIIDPACGSGTLLVGALRKLIAHYPSSPLHGHARNALEQVCGADVSAAATMITRIRLLLAYCEATGRRHISGLPALPLCVATADALLPPQEDTSEPPPNPRPSSSPNAILTQQYSVVVCAPPLISARGSALREAYRARYRSAARNLPLYGLFIERCFQLADAGGSVGVLVGHSFTKREFGRPLVEGVLPAIDLTHVIDTSGVYIPGYGTPTMILLGRNRPPTSEAVRVVVGRRGEPISPIHPGEGRVWSSIVAHLDQPGYEDDYIAVSDVRREQLTRHPWILEARDVAALRETLEHDAVQLSDLAASARRGAHSGLDQVYILSRRTAERLGLEAEVIRPLVRGMTIRDFCFAIDEVALVPPEHDHPRAGDQHPRWWAWLQRFRPVLANRRSFGAVAPMRWWAWLQAPRHSGPRLCIMGPMIAKNNHFAIAAGDLVASAATLAIEPNDTTSETELYAWLAFLNSSTASFWMKQTATSKGHVDGNVRPEEPLYEFSGVTISQLPIPRAIVEPGALRDELAGLARHLERTAKDIAAASPDQVIGRWDRSSREALVEVLADAQLRERTLLRRMVCEQEDLDWLVYEAVGLTNGGHRILKGSASPEQRPFAWLTDEPPVGLDRRLTEAWRRRRKAGQAHGLLRILEAAPYKRAFRGVEDDRDPDLDELRGELDLDRVQPAPRRRDSMDYARRTKLACEHWLLDRLEEVFRDMPPRCVSVQELVSRLGAVAGAPYVASVLIEQRGELSATVLEKLIIELVSAQAVPYLAALRHTESGLEKRAQWEASWELQRRQDAGDLVASIPVPPLYDRTDYRDASTFRHRGRLDAATERFIAYPSEGDAEPRYGWAGWRPVQQAEALVALIKRCEDEGRLSEYVVPLLAGIMELVLWIPSWEGAVPARGSAAETFHVHVQHETGRVGLDIEALRAWRPSHRDRSPQGQGNR